MSHKATDQFSGKKDGVYRMLTIYTVHKKTENFLPGEGYRIKGSYVYESPEAILYGRTIEFLFNGEVEGVDKFEDEFNAVIVDDVLSLYMGDDYVGTFSRRE